MTQYVKITKGKCRGKLAIIIGYRAGLAVVRVLDAIKVTKNNQEDYFPQIIDIHSSNYKLCEYVGPLFY